MRWAIINYAKIIIFSVSLVLALCSNTQAWTNEAPPQYLLSSLKTTNTYPCAGQWGKISVSGEGSIDACIVGNQTRIASYFPLQGPISYAISFSFDTTFYRLSMCEGLWGCVYSEQTDTLLGLVQQNDGENRGAVYKNFVKNLVKSYELGTIRYKVAEHVQPHLVTHPGSFLFYAQTVAVSGNGKWGLIEVRNYGVFRINLESFEVRRIFAPGLTYPNHGVAPSVEMAISNDGNTVAFMGVRSGLLVILVDESCGDRLTAQIQENYLGAVMPCSILNTSPSSYIANFSYALKPRFSSDGSKLFFDVYGPGGSSQHVTLFSNPSDAQNLTDYLAIGDSFTSGEGETDNLFYIGGPSNRCHVSTRSYPYLLATSWGSSAYNVACSGATIDVASGVVSKNGHTSQLLQVEARLPKILTVGIGGNDAGLMGKLKSCLGLDTCDWANSPGKRYGTALEIKNLYPKLKLFYEDLKIKTPGKVVVVGYPTIISEASVCLSEVGVLLNQTERKFMNEGIHYLNEVIRASANDSGLDYIDVEGAFKGSELCSNSFSTSMNGLRLGDDYSVIDAFPTLKVFGAESFHPTPLGHEKLSQVVISNYSEVFANSGCVSCTGQIGSPTPSEYWQDGSVSASSQRAFPFLNKNIIEQEGAFEISLPAYSLQPLSDVVVELHSEIQTVGTFKSAEDGSLAVSISADDMQAGFHSVHLIAKEFTGEGVDVYDFLMINGNESLVLSGELDDKSSSQLVSQSLNLLKAKPNRNVAPEVLGASVATLPINKPAPLNNHRFISKTTTSHGYASLILILIGVVIGVAVAWFAMYLYFRQKQSRYRGG